MTRAERSPSDRLPPGRHSLPREFVVRSQRDRILDAIGRACLEKGYESVTVADIAERAQVSRATFYELFRDKEECFLATFDAILARLMRSAMGAYRRKGESWSERMGSGIRVILEFLAAEPAFAWMCIVEAPAAGPRAVERYMGVVSILAGGVDEGRAHSPAGETVPAVFPSAIIGGAATLVREEILAGRTHMLPGLTLDLAYAVLVPFVGREEALRIARESASRT